MSITAQAVEFVEGTKYSDLPEAALQVGRRCMVDTIGLYLAGSTEEAVRILADEAQSLGGRQDAALLGKTGIRVPAPIAARVLGTAGHAHDWDDTQVSHDPAHVYGLLTHPSVPPLTAALIVADTEKVTDGRDVMLAFQLGFEVECKISEWMNPRHYRRGHHSSGTVGTFGACVAAAKLLGLTRDEIARALGIAASFAAGIRVNFGTMTKPLHVGRACENGVTAALLAARGFGADESALDGPWGFFSVMGEGHDPGKAARGFAAPLSIVDPGVSIKPYPSGILTHQSMDAMLDLVVSNDLKPEDVAQVEFFAGKNIVEPIRYPVAVNDLQAKFSMPALLSMMLIRRRASHHEFRDDFISSPEMQDLQRRTNVIHDPDIDAMGFDKIRSRIVVKTRDGRTLAKEANEDYRGGPSYPISDAELDAKFHMCAEGVIEKSSAAELLSSVRAFDKGADIDRMRSLICG